jgi:NAD(P)-dependent dehydrogenase (short-subunit alcohol dehydrogenase family)
VAQEYLNDGGSITLTSGIVAEQPIRFGAAASMTNAAVEGFVRGAAIELQRGVRINVVSPTVLEESLKRMARFSTVSSRPPPAAWRWPTAAAWKGRRRGRCTRSGKLLAMPWGRWDNRRLNKEAAAP